MASRSAPFGAGRSFTYDAEHRVTGVTVGSVTTAMTYDAGGSRVKKTSGSVSTTYVGRLYECTTSCSKYIFAAGTRVAIKSGTSVYYVHADHLGSSTIVTTSAGTKVEELAYEPYGRLRVRTGSVCTCLGSDL